MRPASISESAVESEAGDPADAAAADGASTDRAPDAPDPVFVDARPLPPVTDDYRLSPRLVEFAAAAVAAELPGDEKVGDYLGARADDAVAVSAGFASTAAGYRGWVWSVTLALVDPDRPTISEVVLLPGPDALLAPEWVPWGERIRPGDLGVGDLLLPPPADDPRLVPAYVESDDPAVEEVAHELGIGRVRVMSRIGRQEIAERWHEGDFGPDSAMAQHAPARCLTCGFYLPLAGSLGAVAGACGNELAPADGRVVDSGYGCGGHSELVLDLPPLSAARETVIDEFRLEVHPRAEIEAPSAAVLDEDASVADLVVDLAPVDPETVSSEATAPGVLADVEAADVVTAEDTVVVGGGIAVVGDEAAAPADTSAAAADVAVDPVVARSVIDLDADPAIVTRDGELSAEPEVVPEPGAE